MQDTTNNILLKVENLKVSYLTNKKYYPAIQGISLHLKAGEKVGIVGHSGCGKTTLVRALTGILLPSQARVSVKQFVFKDNTFSNLNAIRLWQGRGLSLVMQEAREALIPYLTIGEQLNKIIKKHSRWGGMCEEKLSQLLDILNFRDTEKILKSYPHQLSGGENQRAVLLLVFATNPSVIVADEPTSALDYYSQQIVMELLKRYVQTQNSAVLLATHDLNLLYSFADRLYVMDKGVFIEEGTVKDICSSPTHHITSQLITDWRKLTSVFRSKLNSNAMATSNIAVTKNESKINSIQENPQKEVLLELKGVDLVYKSKSSLWAQPTTVKALSDVSLKIWRKDCIAVMGPSGAGKTSLARLILALEQPSKGEIFYRNQKISEFDKKKLYVFVGISKWFSNILLPF